MNILNFTDITQLFLLYDKYLKALILFSGEYRDESRKKNKRKKKDNCGKFSYFNSFEVLPL